MKKRCARYRLALSVAWDMAMLCLRRGLRLSPPQPPALADIRRILVLAYAATGDSLFFLPVIQALRRALPQAKITLVADRAPFTEGILPAAGLVDDIWMVAVQDSRLARRQTERRIRAARFDAVIASHPTPMRFFAGAILSIPIRIGHCRPLEAPHAGWSSIRYALWRLRRGVISEEFERRLAFNLKVWVPEDLEHVVSRNLRLLDALRIPHPSAQESRPLLPEPQPARTAAEKFLAAIPAGQPVVGLHIGSPQSQYKKIWSMEAWAAACKALAQRRRLQFVMLGGPLELEFGRRFSATSGLPCLDLAGRLDMLTTFAVIRRCRLFLSNDTGLAKAAMALDIPTATVWGPSDRTGYGILWNPQRHLEIFRRLPCAPCVRMGLRQEGAGVVNYETCPAHACLQQLEPEHVAGAIWTRYGALLMAEPDAGPQNCYP